MKKSPACFSIPLVLIMIFTNLSYAASTKYVTDRFKITLRSGTSVSNSIVQMLNSGQAVTVIEEDLASQYSLVETPQGKKGYVLSRQLVETKPAWEQLEFLQATANSQQEKIAGLNSDLTKLNTRFGQAIADNNILKKTLLASENELSQVKNAAEDTLNILDENQQLKIILESLREEKQALREENVELKDSTRIDWFVRGAAVSLVAFLLGIFMTRIRWRKQDSWGSH